jgi:hypothetical protein
VKLINIITWRLCAFTRVKNRRLSAFPRVDFMNENEIAREIVDAAYKVHTTLGPGLLETAYETMLAYK